MPPAFRASDGRPARRSFVTDDRNGKSEGGERKPFSTVETQFLAAGDAMDAGVMPVETADDEAEAAPTSWASRMPPLLRRRAREIAAAAAAALLLVGALWDDSAPTSPPAPILAVSAVAAPIASDAQVLNAIAEPTRSEAREATQRPHHHKPSRRADSRR
jgi:hypothetical protein